MSINFCNEKFGTKIFSEKIAQDGYEISNLISNNVSLKNKGFRADYFIKPPINISLVLPMIVDIRYLRIGLKSGEHRTSCIDISVKSSYLNNQVTSNYKFIGKYYTKKSFIVIINSGYRINKIMKQKGLKIDEINQEDCEIFYVPRRCRFYFSQVISIQLRLLSSVNSSICCLNNLEVLGQPLENQEIEDKIDWLINESNKKEAASSQHFKGMYGCSGKNSSSVNNKVPDEFIDPITNEIMINPIILPSGHTIDKTTLERYIENESKWNRRPNNPFTKINFTESYEPIPNTELKAKIDLFINTRNNLSS